MSTTLFTEKPTLSLQRFVSTFLTSLRQGCRHHALPHALGALILLSGYMIMQWSGGSQITPSVEKYVSKYVVFAATCVFAVLLAWKLLAMVFVEKPERPLSHLAGWAFNGLTDPHRLANGIHGSIFIFLVMSGFTMWKNQVAVLGQFAWDPALVEVERLLHFGALPQDILEMLAQNIWTLKLIDQAYVIWFPVLFGSTLVASFQSERSDLRWRFMVAFAVIWGLGGIVTANAFSSAGPVYYATLHGANSPYAAHMALLTAQSQVMSIEALGLQDVLWQAYAATPSFSSISAFPSMHVAITTLVFLTCRHLAPWIKWLATIYLALIFIGSIVLGWHYAIDGYAGAAIAFFSWKLTGFAVKKQHG